MHRKKLYGTATVGTKGQVVIPAEAREEFSIEAGTRLYVVGSPDHKWIGFLPENEMREMVDRQMDDIQSLQSELNKKINQSK
jgi:AbrB family looped-hinge helix DNA binding protein